MLKYAQLNGMKKFFDLIKISYTENILIFVFIIIFIFISLIFYLNLYAVTLIKILIYCALIYLN